MSSALKAPWPQVSVAGSYVPPPTRSNVAAVTAVGVGPQRAERRAARASWYVVWPACAGGVNGVAEEVEVREVGQPARRRRRRAAPGRTAGRGAAATVSCGCATSTAEAAAVAATARWVRFMTGLPRGGRSAAGSAARVAARARVVAAAPVAMPERGDVAGAGARGPGRPSRRARSRRTPPPWPAVRRASGGCGRGAGPRRSCPRPRAVRRRRVPAYVDRDPGRATEAEAVDVEQARQSVRAAPRRAPRRRRRSRGRRRRRRGSSPRRASRRRRGPAASAGARSGARA